MNILEYYLCSIVYCIQKNLHWKPRCLLTSCSGLLPAFWRISWRQAPNPNINSVTHNVSDLNVIGSILKPRGWFVWRNVRQIHLSMFTSLNQTARWNRIFYWIDSLNTFKRFICRTPFLFWWIFNLFLKGTIWWWWWWFMRLFHLF